MITAEQGMAPGEPRPVEMLRPVLDASRLDRWSGAVATGVEADSRRIRPGDVFVAVRGTRRDGHAYLGEAIHRGAVAVVVEDEKAAREAKTIPLAVVPCARRALARLAALFAGHPASSLVAIGITGTNGKTTTASLLHHRLSASGRAVGMVGTVVNRFGGEMRPAAMTTPEPIELHALLRRFVDKGAKHAVLETSSHALAQHRLEGIRFSRAIFTRLGRDHLDYHGGFEAYFAAKASLFEGLDREAVAILDAADERQNSLARGLAASVLRYGTGTGADVRASIRARFRLGTHFRVQTPYGSAAVHLRMPGMHNVSNALAALACALSLGVKLDQACEAMETFEPVPGRLEPVLCGQPFEVYVDYAHTEDALAAVLQAIRPHTRARILLVFGCGGDRDRTKRSAMGAVAAEHADETWITTDNARSEDPAAIARAVLAGFGSDLRHVRVVLDREVAIREAIENAEEGDTVLLAGKGHEKLQTVGDRVIPFDDVEEARSALWSRYGSKALRA